MPLQETSGNISADAYGGGAAKVANYIEDVFSTYLYTGNGSTQTITNGIDLSGKGGLVWIKRRNGIRSHALLDTARGASVGLSSNTTDANTTYSPALMTSFNSDGFSLNSNIIGNNSSDTYASWSFREQAKFFDIVTYTGNGVSGRTISHNLGSTPGCIIVKCTSTAGEYWAVYHTSTGPTKFLWLQDTIDATTASTYWNDTAPTSSVFSVGNDGAVNGNGKTYVAYLFAHNAGGFGATGTDNVISCGSYTGTGSSVSVTLGYEPQWVMIKRTDSTGNWVMLDNMRGTPYSQAPSDLYANTSGAEQQNFGSTSTGFITNPTGFGWNDGSLQINANGGTYIYIAIRRGPMKVPTDATKVFKPSTYSGNNTTKSITGTGFAPDLVINKPRANTLGSGSTGVFWDRLRGFPDGSSNPALVATSTQTESTWASLFNMFGYINNTNSNPQDGYQVINGSTDGRYVNYSSEAIGYISWLFKRAPSFFDEVCYTGTGVAKTVNHNLNAVPELMIVKGRDIAQVWPVYTATVGNNGYMQLSSTGAATTGDSGSWNNTSPTSTVFTVGTAARVNSNTYNYVAYLFASCPGVSKVGSYTGNGSTQTINCGFTGGARFVLIKRTDSAGAWYVYDTARGMTVLTDPYVLMNDAAAEVATLGSVTTTSVGFALNASILSDINVNGGTYIYLAIA